MPKLNNILAIALVAISVLPTLAFAKDNNNNHEGHGLALGVMLKHDLQKMPVPKILDPNNKHDKDKDERPDNPDQKRAVSGTISATSTTSFSLTDSQGTVCTINTSGATIVTAFGQTIALVN